MKPTPPTIRALDADGSEFWLDANGLAFRADCSRVPELDGPPLHAPLDRGEVAKALHAAWLEAQGGMTWNMRDMPRKNVARNADLTSRMRAIESCAESLGVLPEFNAMIAGEVQP